VETLPPLVAPPIEKASLPATKDAKTAAVHFILQVSYSLMTCQPYVLFPNSFPSSDQADDQAKNVCA
jgi:hypothetical protein